MNEYYNHLLKQFVEAKGIKNVDEKSETFIEDFINWSVDRKLTLKNYISIIGDTNVFPLYDETTAEVGKGVVDSIGKELGIKLITPYGEKMNNPKNVIPANLEVLKGIPTVVKGCNDNLILLPLNPRRFRNFITQNPYDKGCIKNWNDLHNSGEYNIIIGVYGETSDKDRQSKIKMLKEFKDKLENGYREEQAIIYGNYYYLVYSDNPIKRLTKTR